MGKTANTTTKLKDKGISYTDVREVKGKIKILKLSREEADYHDKEIGYQQGKAALTLSTEIIGLINKKL